VIRIAHVIMGLYAPPEVHEKFMKDVNHWRYKAEGKFRKGDIAPFVSEIKMYDVRLPEEIIPQFVRDIEGRAPESLIEYFQNTPSNNNKGMLKRVISFFLKFNPLKKVEKASGPQKYKLDSWSYAFVFGKMDDHLETNVLTGEKREVL
jgi:hypothetical protein